MALTIISRLLLLTLPLQAMTDNELETHATPEHDDSFQYGEFCLRISDQPHWASSKPVPQLPTESTSQEPKPVPQLPTESTSQEPKPVPQLPTESTSQEPKPVPQLPTESTSQEPKTVTQPTQPNQASTPQPTYNQSAPTPTQQTPAHLSFAPQPETTTQKDQEEVVTQKIRDIVPPAGALVSRPCRCERVVENLGPGAPQLRSLFIENPTATCSVREFIVMMSDGRKVCLSKLAASAYLNNKFGRTDAGSYKVPSVSTSAPQNPTKGLRTNSAPGKFMCVNCSEGENLENFDPEDVQSVQIMALSHGCPALVFVIMMKRAQFCIDSAQPGFKILLEKLNI